MAATGFTSPGGAQDVLTARLSPGGHTRWSHTYNGPDNLADQGAFVAGGPGGAVYVAGTSDGATTATDILTLKYSKAGHRSWARRFTSAGAVNDLAAGLVVTSGQRLRGRAGVSDAERGGAAEVQAVRGGGSQRRMVAARRGLLGSRPRLAARRAGCPRQQPAGPRLRSPAGAILRPSWAASSVGRAPPLHGGGQGFDSPAVHQLV